MHDWMRYLESIGVNSVRLHDLEVETDSVAKKYQLSTEETIEAFLSFEKLEKELTHIKFDVFKDMRSLLLGEDNATTCIWNACDPYTTRAVQGVEGNGQQSNCGRTNKDGIDFTKANTEGFERYIALYHTPQEHGGCQGCRFFLMCKGNCPGTSINGDWRNRTESCDLWKGLYRHLEEELLDEGQSPVSTRPERKQLEQIVVNTWTSGQNTNIATAIQQLKNGQDGSAVAQYNQHGDSHGDHTDQGTQSMPLPSLVED